MAQQLQIAERSSQRLVLLEILKRQSTDDLAECVIYTENVAIGLLET